VADVAPAGTVTLAGSVIGSPPVSVTTAPPVGAGPDSLTVPEMGSPPATVVLATVIATSVERAVTVSVDDCMPLPFIDALMAAVPGASAAIVKVVLDDPAATVTDPGTVATAVLLLVSATVAPPVGAAALSVTVPCSLPPAARLGALNETADMPVVVVDGDVEEPPHCTVLRSAATAAAHVIEGGTRQVMYLMPAEASTTVPRARLYENAPKPARMPAAVQTVASGLVVHCPPYGSRDHNRYEVPAA